MLVAMFNLPWKLFYVAVTMSKLEVPGTRNYLHFLTQRSPQSTALEGLPGFSPEELLWDALPGEQTCRRQNISRYGDAHGRYAKCLNPRCLTKVARRSLGMGLTAIAGILILTAIALAIGGNDQGPRSGASYHVAFRVLKR